MPIQRILLTCSLLVASLSGVLGLKMKAIAQPDKVSVTIYDRGKQLNLAADVAAVQELVSRCEAQMRTADTMLKLAVTPQLIANLRRQEVTIEIRYSQPQTFIISFNGQTVEPMRILIPLTGEFAQGVTTIFYGRDQYAHGPYRNSQGQHEISTVVAKLGIQVD
ncbi:MAG TPA: hypothetical protein VGC99_24270 [Candidatus Tectomicrobia bacterium]